MKTSLFKGVLFLIAAVFTADQLLSAGPAQQAAVKTENGVRVVRNPGTPVEGPGGKVAAVDLVEEMVIGNDTSREDHWFGFLNAVDADAEGRIYTVDPKNIRIRIFGPDGSLVKAFGRAGQGPGEFSGPGGIVALPDGTFVVSDVINSRLSYFTREGAHVKDAPYGGYRFVGLAVDSCSNFYITNALAPSGDTQTFDLLKLDPSMKPLAKVHSLSIPFKPRATYLIFARLFFALAGQDRLAWMVSTNYEVHVADGSGKTVMRILKDHDARKVTDKDRAAILKSRFPKGAPTDIGIEFPDDFPAAAGFMADEKGRIFVWTYETDGQGGSAIDVFGPDGLYIARFFVPESDWPVTIRNDKLYVIVKESASGNPLVKRYALKWR